MTVGIGVQLGHTSDDPDERFSVRKQKYWQRSAGKDFKTPILWINVTTNWQREHAVSVFQTHSVPSNCSEEEVL